MGGCQRGSHTARYECLYMYAYVRVRVPASRRSLLRRVRRSLKHRRPLGKGAAPGLREAMPSNSSSSRPVRPVPLNFPGAPRHCYSRQLRRVEFQSLILGMHGASTPSNGTHSRGPLRLQPEAPGAGQPPQPRQAHSPSRLAFQQAPRSCICTRSYALDRHQGRAGVLQCRNEDSSRPLPVLPRRPELLSCPHCRRGEHPEQPRTAALEFTWPLLAPAHVPPNSPHDREVGFLYREVTRRAWAPARYFLRPCRPPGG